MMRSLFINRVYFVLQAKQVATLGYIRVDHYSDLLAGIGTNFSGKLLLQLAVLLKEYFQDVTDLAHFADYGFAVLLLEQQPKALEDSFQKLLSQVSSHFFEIEGRAVSIWVCVLEGTDCSAQAVIDRAYRMVNELVGGNVFKVFDSAHVRQIAAKTRDISALL